MSDALSLTTPSRGRFTCFKLGTLFVFMALLAVGLTMWNEFSKTEVAATLRIYRRIPEAAALIPDNELSESDYPRYCQTQIELLRSNRVLDRALRDSKVLQLPIAQQSDAVHWLHKNLQIRMLGNSELLQIKLTSHAPDDCVTLIDAIVLAYFRENHHKEVEDAKATREFFERICRDKEHALLQEREKIGAIADALKVHVGDSEDLWAHPIIAAKIVRLKSDQASLEEMQRTLQRLELLQQQGFRVKIVEGASLR